MESRLFSFQFQTLTPTHVEEKYFSDRLLEEGRQEGEVRLLLRILLKRFGELGDRHIQNINQLTLAKLEALGEALLDFENISDLDRWLEGL